MKLTELLALIERTLKSLVAGHKRPQPRLVPVPVRSYGRRLPRR